MKKIRIHPGNLGKQLLSTGNTRTKRILSFFGHSLLFLITGVSVVSVLFIFIFIFRDALPFFKLEGFKEFFTSTKWYPSSDNPSFGALSLFFGSAIVTTGAVIVSVPLGVIAAVCLSDVLSFSLRQIMKPVIEILAAIPSVAYGFFALVIFAPLLQDSGGNLLAMSSWIVCTPLILLITITGSGLLASKISPVNSLYIRIIAALIIGIPLFTGLWFLSSYISGIQISSGTNALNVSIILGIMALPTVVSVSDDSLTAVDRSLREGSYALGATRAETLIKVVIPAAKGGIVAAVILGIMRAIGETMVVWMASGNAAKIPHPWFNFLEPIRTLTATIAGDMGEADQVTGSSRYHVLFALALCLLLFTFICNLIGEKFIRRSKKITR